MVWDDERRVALFSKLHVATFARLFFKAKTFHHPDDIAVENIFAFGAT
jgi:hypothetical protein